MKIEPMTIRLLLPVVLVHLIHCLFSDFIDVFMIGDGEDSIIETCRILEQTKGLPRKRTHQGTL